MSTKKKRQQKVTGKTSLACSFGSFSFLKVPELLSHTWDERQDILTSELKDHAAYFSTCTLQTPGHCKARLSTSYLHQGHRCSFRGAKIKVKAGPCVCTSMHTCCLTPASQEDEHCILQQHGNWASGKILKRDNSTFSKATGVLRRFLRKPTSKYCHHSVRECKRPWFCLRVV